jgi:hypothetical protein
MCKLSVGRSYVTFIGHSRVRGHLTFANEEKYMMGHDIEISGNIHLSAAIYFGTCYCQTEV